MERYELYRCDICGNMVEIRISGGGELVCCGKPMKKLEPKYHEEAVMEKHVPVIIKHDDKNGEIRVGEILHPMTDEHYIMFIQAISEDKKYSGLKYLNPNEEPKMLLDNLEHKIYAREFCNIHGLWEGKNND